MTPDDLKVKNRKWIEIVNKRNLDELSEVFSADVIYHLPPFPDIVGFEAYIQFVTDFVQSFPDFQLGIEELVAEGNITTIRWTFTGTYTGPSATMPIPPNGKQVVGINCTESHWVNGRISEAWQISDWLGFFQQLSMTLAPVESVKQTG